MKKESWSRVSSARPLYQKFGFSDVGSGETVSHRKLLSSKAMAVNVAEKSNEISAGMIERGERKRTADDVSKAD